MRGFRDRDDKVDDHDDDDNVIDVDICDNDDKDINSLGKHDEGGFLTDNNSVKNNSSGIQTLLMI